MLFGVCCVVSVVVGIVLVVLCCSDCVVSVVLLVLCC